MSAGPMLRYPHATCLGLLWLAGQAPDVAPASDEQAVLALSNGELHLYQLGDAAGILGERLLKTVKRLLEAGLIAFDDPLGVPRLLRHGDRRFGQIALARALLTEPGLEAGLQHQQEKARKGRYMWLGEVLVELGHLRPSQVQEVLAIQRRLHQEGPLPPPPPAEPAADQDHRALLAEALALADTDLPRARQRLHQGLEVLALRTRAALGPAVGASPEAARACHRRAEGGDREAALAWGCRLEDVGRRLEALVWYRRAAKAGDPLALGLLAAQELSADFPWRTPETRSLVHQLVSGVLADPRPESETIQSFSPTLAGAGGPGDAPALGGASA